LPFPVGDFDLVGAVDGRLPLPRGSQQLHELLAMDQLVERLGACSERSTAASAVQNCPGQPRRLCRTAQDSRGGCPTGSLAMPNSSSALRLASTIHHSRRWRRSGRPARRGWFVVARLARRPADSGLPARCGSVPVPAPAGATAQRRRATRPAMPDHWVCGRQRRQIGVAGSVKEDGEPNRHIASKYRWTVWSSRRRRRWSTRTDTPASVKAGRQRGGAQRPSTAGPSTQPRQA